MRRNKLNKYNCKSDGRGGLFAFNTDGAVELDIPAHTLQGKETTEFSLTLRRSAKSLLDEEAKPLPTGRKYQDMIEAAGQAKLKW